MKNYMLVTFCHILCLLTTGQSVKSDGLKEVFAWKQMDFLYPNKEVRSFAISTGAFVTEGAINPLGVAAAGSRVFISMPRWKYGVPATLATVPYPSNTSSPLLTPYPNWAWSRLGFCDGLTSVYRVKVDECDRLWVVDTGVVNSFVKTQKICPTQVVAFDLKTDKMLLRYRFPKEVMKTDTQLVTIEVEYPAGSCGAANSAVLYVADVNAFGLVVVDLASKTSWRVQHRTMYPAPDAGVIRVNNEDLELMDGTIGLALSPKYKEAALKDDTETRSGSYAPGVSNQQTPSRNPSAGNQQQNVSKRKERVLYYYPMSSYRMYWVQTDVLRNETLVQSSPQLFHLSQGKRISQAAGCSMDKNGVLFYGMVSDNSLACWNTRKAYFPGNLMTLAQNNDTMQFIATTTVDNDGRLWAISTRVQKFFLNTQDTRDVNFRVLMSPSTEALVRGTVCDHKASIGNSDFVYLPQ